MSAQHTPGPWRYISRNVDEKANWACRIPFAIEHVPERSSCVEPIADVLASTLLEVCDQPHAEANARLIAAAPEMLAVLERVRRWAEGDNINYMGDHPIALVRAAIAKATGSAA